MNGALGPTLAAAALVVVSGCMSANGRVSVLPPSGQTIAGPGRFEATIPGPGARPVSFFFQAPRVRPDVCVTVLNTGETSITLVLAESLGVPPPLEEERIFAGNDKAVCAPGVGSAQLECAGESAGKACSALWRVDQLRPKSPAGE